MSACLPVCLCARVSAFRRRHGGVGQRRGRGLHGTDGSGPIGESEGRFPEGRVPEAGRGRGRAAEPQVRRQARHRALRARLAVHAGGGGHHQVGGLLRRKDGPAADLHAVHGEDVVVPLLQVHPRLAHPVVPHAALLVQLHVPQRGPEDLQRGHGLRDGGPPDLELWRGGHGVHPLEGAAGAAAGLPDRRQRAHGVDLRQVPARVVGLGHPGRRLHLRFGGRPESQGPAADASGDGAGAERARLPRPHLLVRHGLVDAESRGRRGRTTTTGGRLRRRGSSGVRGTTLARGGGGGRGTAIAGGRRRGAGRTRGQAGTGGLHLLQRAGGKSGGRRRRLEHHGGLLRGHFDRTVRDAGAACRMEEGAPGAAHLHLAGSGLLLLVRVAAAALYGAAGGAPALCLTPTLAWPH
ncbi:presenilin-2 isoform X3 [Stigmatopora nigra]